MTPVQGITRRATRPSRSRLNILVCPTHEGYETNLCKTSHNFYSYHQSGWKTWETKYREVPPNYTLLPDNTIPLDLDFDLVLSGNKFANFQTLRGISRGMCIPLISLEHCLPLPSLREQDLQELKKLCGDVNIFISEDSRKRWGWGENEAEVIHHGVDTEIFSPNHSVVKNKTILSVCNDFINRNQECGYELWEHITLGLPRRIRGNTPGLSTSTKSIGELVHEYRSSQVFLNTSLISPIPMSLMEAMSSGCACVSTSTCMIPEIIQHKYNGYISNDPKELRYFAEKLLGDEKECERIGRNARQTILDNFSLSRFTDNWNGVFERVAHMEPKF